MIGRLLIDECLTPELVPLAIAAGHVESTCLRNRDWLGLKDWQLMEHVLRDDFVLVTRNARDFRGAGSANPGGWYTAAEIHAGLICIGAAIELDFDLQQELFQLALEELPRIEDLTNQALEIFLEENGEVSINLYEIPPQQR